MIATDREYQITKEARKRFLQAKQQTQMHLDCINSEIDVLTGQMVEWEEVKKVRKNGNKKG